MTSSNYSTFSPASPEMATSSSDVFVLSIGVVLAALYLFRDQIFSAAKPKTVPVVSKQTNGSANPRDFIAKMKEAVSIPSCFFLFHVLLCLLNRRNALSYSTVHRPVLLKSMQFVLLRKQSRNLAWLLSSATQRSTILKILTNFQKIALPSL
jgi:hypothetical protein